MPYVHTRFPDLETSLRELVQQHRRLNDERLHLAIAYDAGRHAGDVFLFELVGNFGADRVDPDRSLLETVFAGARVFPVGGQPPDLHLVLTSPEELDVALRDGWPEASALRRAVFTGMYDVLYADAVGERALSRLTAGQAVA